MSRIERWKFTCSPWRWQVQCLPKRWIIFNIRRRSSPKAEVVHSQFLFFPYYDRPRFTKNPSKLFVTCCLYGEELLALHPTPKVKGHTLSAARDCLFNKFVAILRNLAVVVSSVSSVRTCHVVTTRDLLHILEKCNDRIILKRNSKVRIWLWGPYQATSGSSAVT
jgi:hypothetical protein